MSPTVPMLPGPFREQLMCNGSRFREQRMKRGGSLKRSAPKRSQPKRDWTTARAKVEREGRCRISFGWRGTCDGKLEAAHVIGREHDREDFHEPGIIRVDPARIVPLCQRHHQEYDAHQLDLLGYLTPEEEAQAVLDAGSLELARKRLAPSQYRTEAA